MTDQPPFVGIKWDDSTEDWPKRTWDLWNADGTPVSTVAQLAAALWITPAEAVRRVLELPMGKAAPPRLRVEAKRWTP